MENKRINHWCVLCGVGYHACDTCSKQKNFTPWRALTDTIEHYKIFMVLKNYNNKMVSKEKAKELLAGMDLSGQENFKESAKNLLTDIFAEDCEHTSAKTEETQNIVLKKKNQKGTKIKEAAEKETISFEDAKPSETAE